MADLTVMTWNVQNLFPAGHAYGTPTQQDYYDKFTALAEVINTVEPDLLALQEVGPEQVLADLNAACAIDFDHRLTGTADGRGIRVALLSPRQLSNRTDITTYPQGVVPVPSRDLIFDDPATAENEALSDALGRGVLLATLRAGAEKVTVIVSHLKSKLISYARQPGVVGGSTFAPTTKASACAMPATPSLPPHRQGHDVPRRPRFRAGRRWRPAGRGPPGGADPRGHGVHVVVIALSGQRSERAGS